MNNLQYEYVGFWSRVGATLIDSLLTLLVIWPLGALAYGADYWMSSSLYLGPLDIVLNFAPAVAVVAFWVLRGATPGKMAIGAIIVDAKTGARPSVGQAIGRYLGYFVSSIPFGLGLIWVAIDDRKQGWHDKLAGTIVVRHRRADVPIVEFRHGSES